MPENQAMPDDAESLITPAMAAYSGATREHASVTLGRGRIAQLAEGLDETDPDLLAALARPPSPADGEVEVPHWAFFFLGDATYHFDDIPDLPAATLLVSDSIETYGPVHLEETLGVTSRVGDIRERMSGRLGHAVYVDFETEFLRADGALAARNTATIAFFHERAAAEWEADR